MQDKHIHLWLSRQMRKLRYQWRVFQTIMKVLDTHQDLQRLVEWARKKKLDGPLAAYEWRSRKTEDTLGKLRRRYRKTVLVCEWLQTVWT